MTLREKILQTFIVDNHTIKLHGGPKKFFEKYPVGGMYFANNYVEDLGALMVEGAVSENDLIKKCRKYSKTPLFVCVDGIEIPNSVTPDAEAVAGSNDDKIFYDFGKAVGLQCNYNDVDWVLGPCIDLNFARSSDLNSRAVTGDAELNARMFGQVVRGIQDRGVAATVKHFPGQGTYHVNFHFAPGKNILDFDKWTETFGYSYKKMFEEDCMCVMTSHLTFPAYCSEKEDGYPPIATFSSKITVDLLKNELGFKGAVVTDALTMGGMGCGNQAKDAAQAFKCGADFLLWPPMETADIIEEKIQSGEIPISRLDDALERIKRVREFVAKNKKAAPENAGELVTETALKAYKGSAELLKNENNALPLKKNEKILVIGNAPDDGRMEIVKKFAEKLKAKGFNADFQKYLLTCYQEEIDEIIAPYDKIIFVLNHLSCVGVVDNCGSTTWASHLVDKKKKIILNFSSPYIAEDYYPDEPCVVNCNAPLNEYSADAVIKKLTGCDEFTGKTPVPLKNMR